MIVQADFFDHWKTKIVNTRCGAEGVLCVLRLWAFCANRRKYIFENMPAERLEAICGWTAESLKLHQALLDAGFLDVLEDGAYYVHEWDIYNAKLVKNWANGARGGRPANGLPNRNPTETHRKNGAKSGENRPEKPSDEALEEEPTENPIETEEEPTENPIETLGEPTQNPNGQNGVLGYDWLSDKRRLDKIRVKKLNKEKSKDASETKLSAFDIFCDEALNNPAAGLSPENTARLIDAYAEWTEYRRLVKKPYKAQTGKLHWVQMRRLVEDRAFEAGDIAKLITQAITNEWDGWYFPEKIDRICADKERAKKYAPRPEDPMSGAGIPAGAQAFGL